MIAASGGAQTIHTAGVVVIINRTVIAIRSADAAVTVAIPRHVVAIPMIAASGGTLTIHITAGVVVIINRTGIATRSREAAITVTIAPHAVAIATIGAVQCTPA